MDCGGSFDPYVMDFDHRDGEEKCFNVSAAIPMGLNIGRVLEEVAKCDVVCSNCHRMRTKRRMDAARLPVPVPDIPHPRDRTHCPQGHPYTAENTRIRKDRGDRQCRICLRVQGG